MVSRRTGSCMKIDYLKTFELVYLASPYSKYRDGLEAATSEIAKVAAKLIDTGVHLFCPITHMHQIARDGNLEPRDHNLWMRLDHALMQHCDCLVVTKMDGWDKSAGVAEEIKTFEDTGREILYLDPKTNELSASA